jgi:hypothetical protein
MSDPRMAIVMVLVSCTLLPGPASAADRLPAIADVDLNSLTGEGWYRASLLGMPVGYLHSAVSVEETERGPILHAVERMCLKLDFGRGPLEVNATTTTEYGSDLRPQKLRSVQDEFGRMKTVEAVVNDDQIHVRTEAGEIAREKTLAVGPTFGSELMFSVAAMQDKLPDRGHYEFQTFVPELEMLVDFDVDCLGREKIAVNGEEVEALKVTYAADMGDELDTVRLQIDSWLGAGGDLLRQAVPTIMGLVMEKVSEEEALAIATPFTLSDHIPVSQQMGETKRLVHVRLKAGSSSLPAAELVPETHLQHVAPLEGLDAEVTVKAETEEDLAGHSLPVQGPELEDYLASTDIIQSADPAIVAQAREIVGEETDAWAAARKLVNWVYREMTKVDHDPRPITASECLATMKGDCSEHATLLCALTRAVGIPSKFVTGLVYMRGGYFYHAWNEVYVGRWVGVDPTWGECTVDAGHLVLASGSLTSESFASTNLAAVRSMGVLTLEVLDHRTKTADQ